MQEEVGDGATFMNSSHSQRKQYVPGHLKTNDDRKMIEAAPSSSVQPKSTEDKIAALKAYRRARGLCFYLWREVFA